MFRGVVAAAAASLVLVCSATAAVGAVGSARTTPSLSGFALSPADFDSASVASNTTTSVGGMPAFLRVFKPGARLAGGRLGIVVSLVMLEKDAPSAAADFAQVGVAANSSAGREELAKEFGLAFVKGASAGAGKKALSVKKTVVGTAVATGASAIRLPVTFVTNQGTLHMALGFVQGDRIVSAVVLIAPMGLHLSSPVQTRVLAALEHHLQVGFTIASTAAPSVGGTVAEGQTLTANGGSWAGSPSALAYSWSRCDASGGNCTSIAGASGATYVVSSADVGFTLQVTVTATNTLSTAQAASTATTVVA